MITLRLPVSTNQRYGRYVVVGEGQRRGKHRIFMCRCDCGAERLVYETNLRRGTSQSCGCLNREIASAVNTAHGNSAKGRVSPEYQAWQGMKKRCYRTTCKDYPNYGGRGIEVCDRWRSSFELFLSDVGQRPTAAHSIDRINVHGNYEPGNVRWAIKQVQNSNTRQNRYLTLNGEIKTIVEWARSLGCSHATISARIRRGWTVEQALTEKPVVGRNQSGIPGSRVSA
jgi:hypothetical protein